MKDYYAGLGPAGVELLGLGAQDMPVGTDEVREAMDAYRAEVLREAADYLNQRFSVTNRAASALRRLAELEAQRGL